MSSSQTNKSDTLADDSTLPSSLPSVKTRPRRSGNGSQKSSRPSSPAFERIDEETFLKKRPTRSASADPTKEKMQKKNNEPRPKERTPRRSGSAEEKDNGKRKLDTTVELKKSSPEHGSKKMVFENGQFLVQDIEPDAPSVSVTGLPLEAPPTKKIKKESLWPKKKGKRGGARKKREDSVTSKEDSEEDDNVNDSSLISVERIEEELKKNLKTNMNEELQKPSELRSSRHLKPVAKKGAKQIKEETKTVVPQTPKKRSKLEKKESKTKIKNASPKKLRENPFGFNNPMNLAGTKRDNAFDFSDNTKDNEDFCSACGEPGIFLCCETCPKSFHFACCNPPFDEENLPEDEWSCIECRIKYNPPQPNEPGLFAKLLNQMDRTNPAQFRLPKRIRDRFEGVVTGKFGEYEDTDYKPYRPAKVGAFEQTDPELHYDKEGNPLYCVRCGLTGITPNKTIGEVDKPIITCEYCPSSWHLDCLNPPLSTVKQLGTKWKCPNHADHLLPNKKRRLRKPNIVDVDKLHGFKNDGDIDIRLEEEEEEEPTAASTVSLPTPPFFKNRDTLDGVAAELSKQQTKLWNDDFVIHRVSEKGIVLDFFAKVQDQNKLRQQKINKALKLNEENHKLLQKLSQTDEYDSNEKGALKSLVELKDSDFQDLLRVTGEELSSLQDSPNPSDLTQDEIKELLHIKKLMSLKGKDKLLAFLQD